MPPKKAPAAKKAAAPPKKAEPASKKAATPSSTKKKAVPAKKNATPSTKKKTVVVPSKKKAVEPAKKKAVAVSPTKKVVAPVKKVDAPPSKNVVMNLITNKINGNLKQKNLVLDKRGGNPLPPYNKFNYNLNTAPSLSDEDKQCIMKLYRDDCEAIRNCQWHPASSDPYGGQCAYATLSNVNPYNDEDDDDCLQEDDERLEHQDDGAILFRLDDGRLGVVKEPDTNDTYGLYDGMPRLNISVCDNSGYYSSGGNKTSRRRKTSR